MARSTKGCLRDRSIPSRPSWRGLDAPEVLLSGNHEKIAVWRREQAFKRTKARRPDLLP
jgi:tRNA (guanine37-N1)-methyltransferase